MCAEVPEEDHFIVKIGKRKRGIPLLYYSNVTEKSGIYENVFIHMTTSLSKNMQKKREKCQKSTYLSENIAILTNL